MVASISHRLRRIYTACQRFLAEIALTASAEVIATAMHLSAQLHVAVSVAALIAGSRLRPRRP